VFAPGKPFQSTLIFVGKAGKSCQGQSLLLIMNINELQKNVFVTMGPAHLIGESVTKGFYDTGTRMKEVWLDPASATMPYLHRIFSLANKVPAITMAVIASISPRAAPNHLILDT
jgi:hypothetical protein